MARARGHLPREPGERLCVERAAAHAPEIIWGIRVSREGRFGCCGVGLAPLRARVAVYERHSVRGVSRAPCKPSALSRSRRWSRLVTLRATHKEWIGGQK